MTTLQGMLNEQSINVTLPALCDVTVNSDVVSVAMETEDGANVAEKLKAAKVCCSPLTTCT